MMTDPTGARSDDPNWLLIQLRADIVAADNEADLPDALTPAEVWAAETLAKQNIAYPAVLEAAADALIEPVTVSPQARQRFIVAAERALAARRAELGPLPVVLAAARKRADLTLGEVQAALDQAGLALSASDLEAGRVSIRDAGHKATATWIHAARANRQKAREAAARSLDADLGGEMRPAAGNKTGRAATEEWLAELDTQLDHIEGSDQ
jgi:hypothetical protein